MEDGAEGSLDELDFLRLEANTFGGQSSVGSFYSFLRTTWCSCELQKQNHRPVARKPYMPTSTLAQAIIYTSPLLTELIA